MAACENCTKGFVLSGEPTGSIIPEFNGAYLAKGPEGYTKRAVVYLSDMFGLPLVNSKIMADYLAKTLSCDVWAPDMFDGKPMATAAEMEPLMPDRASAPWTVSQKLRMYGKLIPRIFNVYSNRPAAVEARVIAFLEKLREEKKYDSVGAVGYCYGGMICVRIAPHSTLVDSVVICHPGEITAEQVNAMKVPSAWACAEEDMTFSHEMRKQSEQLLADRKGKEDFVDYEFIDYKGTAHGFACRPNLAVPEVKEGYEKALEQTVAWFEKTLPA